MKHCIWLTASNRTLVLQRMPSPRVAGVAALLMSADPSASATDIPSAMESSAEDLGSTSGRDKSYGYGLVDANAALQ